MITYYHLMAKSKIFLQYNFKSTRSMTIIFIFSLIPLVIFVYFYFHSKYNYWRTRGIPCVPGIIPVFGHMWSLVTLKESFPTLCERIYQQNENSSMVGFYQFKTPTLLIRDSELAKMILVTNFSNFGENQILLDRSNELLLNL